MGTTSTTCAKVDHETKQANTANKTPPDKTWQPKGPQVHNKEPRGYLKEVKKGTTSHNKFEADKIIATKNNYTTYMIDKLA